jgi:beta-lactamase regulating signal transducer with metallopeptidase domain/HEAT repeat protein
MMSRAIDTVSAMSPLALFAMVWAIVVAGILVSLAWAGLAVRRIVRNARTLQSDDWMTPLLEISDRLALEEPPRLLQSDTTKMPFACGMLKATIVLPADSEQWTLDRRRAVLLHELAHVRRHDLLGHTLGRIACAVYWFHPLVWTAAKRLRNESERACDDLALSCGTRATDYAEHLLDIVTTVRGDATPLVALAMARRKEFEGRMLAILDPDQRRAGPTRKQSAALIAALALIALTVGATSPVARAASAATVASNVAVTAPVATPTPAMTPAPQAQKKAYPDSGVRGVSDTGLNVILHVKSATGTSTSTSTSISTRTNTNVVVNSKPLEQAAEALANQGARFGINVASAVLESLGGKGEKGDKGAKDLKDERTDLLAKVLRTDSSASLRRTAAWALAERTNNQVAVDALVNALRKDTDARVREMAAWALGDGGDHSNGALEALNAALKSDASEKVRATSAWALGQLSDHASTDVLAAALSDPDSHVRERAAWALGEVGERHAPKALVALLGDNEPRVRTLAAWALYSIEDPSTAPALQAAMKKEQNQDVQVSMLRALSALGEQSVDAIKDLLDSPDPKVKQMAVRALAGGRASGPWPWPWPDPRPFP